MHAFLRHCFRNTATLLSVSKLHRDFQSINLRWGVTLEQDALSVCREVVDECRPRFLCMPGGRYGWVPPGKTRSITADEVHYGVLDRHLKSRGGAERVCMCSKGTQVGSWARRSLPTGY